jgi:CNT family concentrative nucleoside transporter
MDGYNLVSATGLVVLMAIAWAFSRERRRLNVRCIVWGVVIQLSLGAVVFHAPGSTRLFAWLNDAVIKLLTAAQSGLSFLFGPLADPQKTGSVLALQALPVIIFFSALMGLLYYWRIMPLVIRGFAWVFTRLMRISGAESFYSASSIFVGIEAATTVRPFLVQMTRSEFCTLLVAGMATVASSTMAVYVNMLQDVFPGIAGHLITASILSAPAAIVMSKIVYPEDGQPLTLGKSIRPQIDREAGAIEAVISGAMAGVKLVVGICALLIAFLGLIALVNLGLGAFGPVGGQPLSLERLLGYVFRPLAAVVGVPWSDARLAGDMLGVRLVATEIPAYQALQKAMAEGAFVHPRSPIVIAYCLCGFAHVASLAIFVGGIAALVPERRRDLAAVGPRALLAATLACLMTGAVAGTFFVK